MFIQIWRVCFLDFKGLPSPLHTPTPTYLHENVQKQIKQKLYISRGKQTHTGLDARIPLDFLTATLEESNTFKNLRKIISKSKFYFSSKYESKYGKVKTV